MHFSLSKLSSLSYQCRKLPSYCCYSLQSKSIKSYFPENIVNSCNVPAGKQFEGNCWISPFCSTNQNSPLCSASVTKLLHCMLCYWRARNSERAVKSAGNGGRQISHNGNCRFCRSEIPAAVHSHTINNTGPHTWASPAVISLNLFFQSGEVVCALRVLISEHQLQHVE